MSMEVVAVLAVIALLLSLVTRFVIARVAYERYMCNALEYAGYTRDLRELSGWQLMHSHPHVFMTNLRIDYPRRLLQRLELLYEDLRPLLHEEDMRTLERADTVFALLTDACDGEDEDERTLSVVRVGMLCILLSFAASKCQEGSSLGIKIKVWNHQVMEWTRTVQYVIPRMRKKIMEHA